MTPQEAAGAGGAAPAGADETPDAPWHRLHPATPLLRGGVVLLVVLSFIVGQLRDVVIQGVAGNVIGDDLPPDPDDPADRWLVEHLPLALGILALVVVAILVLGWLSWWLHEYRITDEIVEEQEGVLRRKHRRARLDRIQSVDVVRPFLPRLFGAARLDIAVAGNDGNIRLVYLRSAEADRLKAEILLAAGRARVAGRPAPAAAQAGEAFPSPGGLSGAVPPPGGGTASQSVLDRRIQEFTAPELDERLAAPDSIVRMHPGRLIGSAVLDLVPMAFWFAVFVVAAAWGARTAIVVVTAIPIVIALGSVLWRRVTNSLRYSIAATPDGIRVGFGLLSTTNETLPHGRIHAVEVVQPLLWRPFGWWKVRINRASTSTRDGADGMRNTTILPVGTADEVARVLDLIVPGLDAWGPEGWTTSPPRAAWFRWFSWRRNGFRVDRDAVLLRKGAVWRTLTIVPLARLQSVALESGPLARAVRLARVEVHTVAGVIRPAVGALDAADAERLWREAERRTVTAMADAA